MSAPAVETQNEQTQVEQPEGASVQIVSRDEKKARKAIKEAGCKKVSGVNRVVLRKRGGVSFVVENPEVYRTPNGSYIVFGPARVQEQDFAKQLAAISGQQEGDDKSPAAINADLEAAVENAKITEETDAADDEGPAETNWDDDQIKMIMEQANVSRGKAIKALDENQGDLVNALMALTM